MTKEPFAFPDWINELVPDDALFARAYQNSPDYSRAWMKTAIARLYDWYGPRKDVGGEIFLRWNGGFDTKSVFDPVDFAVILFDGSLQSPARLLAALVPALAGGVKNILAVRVGNSVPWRDAMLTGLELAGQERIVDMTDVQARRLFTGLRESGASGAVVVLGPKAASIKSSELQSASRISFWRPRFSRSAVVWMDDESTFDMEALAFMHPDIVFSIFGAEPSILADNFSYEGDEFDEYLDAITDVAYLSGQRMDQALKRAKLVLGPGQEGCWVWPDLHSGHFQFHRTAWTTGA